MVGTTRAGTLPTFPRLGVHRHCNQWTHNRNQKRKHDLRDFPTIRGIAAADAETCPHGKQKVDKKKYSGSYPDW